MKTFVFIAIAVAAFATQAHAGCSPFTPAQAQAACDKCNFTRSYVQYVADPCDCNLYYSCEKTRGFITAHPQRCARCLCFSNETWGCTIRDSTRPDCPKEALITEQIYTQKPNFCFRLGNGPAGNYLQQYQPLPPNDPDYQKYFYWIVNDAPLKMRCPPGTYFNFARCQCITCDYTITWNCREWDPVLFCLDNDLSGTNKGVYFNQDPSCQIVPNAALSSDVLSLNGLTCDVEVPYFQKNQFSEFTFCGLFLLDPLASLPTTIIYDGGRPSDDCQPSISIGIDANSRVFGTIYTNQVWTVVHPTTILRNTWYKVCLKYDGANKKLEIYVDATNNINFLPVTVNSTYAEGSTNLNNCNLLIGSWFNNIGVHYYFKGLLDHWCFARNYLANGIL